MLFDVRPKERRSDLYDFERELEELKRGLERTPITLLIGVRRTGKTSLLKVALSELGYPYVYLDTRVSTNPTYRDFANIVKYSLEDFIARSTPLRRKIVERLRRVSGISISISPLSVNISWRGDKRFELLELFNALNKIGSDIGEPVIIAFDEAQELRRITWIDFTRVFAYIYDNLEYIRLALTGSEIGLLYRFINVNSGESPLYGRYIHVVSTRRLSLEESLDFLEKGFREVGVIVPRHVIEAAASVFGGIIGWLTLFGYNCYMNINTCSESIEKVIKIAVETAKREVENFLKTRRSERYRVILKLLTIERSWSEIKNRLEDIEGRTINDKTFNELLTTLLNLSIIEKTNNKYIIADPITRKAVEELVG
ncbi:MAG: ATP-binding protein [Thermosphaera sp.]|nr:ATP-binding protein [Thermosphaera sp.]